MESRIKFSESIYSKDDYKEYHATIGRRKANQKIGGMQSAGGRSTIRLKIWTVSKADNSYLCEIICCPFSERTCGQWTTKIHIHADNIDAALEKVKKLSLTYMMSAIDSEIQHLHDVKKNILSTISEPEKLA